MDVQVSVQPLLVVLGNGAAPEQVDGNVKVEVNEGGLQVILQKHVPGDEGVDHRKLEEQQVDPNPSMPKHN